MEQDQLHNADCQVDFRFGRFTPRCQICRRSGNDSPPKPCPFVGARPRPTVNCHDQPLWNESLAARTTTVTLLTRTETFDRSVRTRWNDVQELTPADPTVGRCRLEGRSDPRAHNCILTIVTQALCVRRAIRNKYSSWEGHSNYARKPHHWGINDSQRNKYIYMNLKKNYFEKLWQNNVIHVWLRTEQKSIWFVRIKIPWWNKITKFQKLRYFLLFNYS